MRSATSIPSRPAGRPPIRSGATRRGFTLIELLTVIGIIAILVGILLPVMKTVRQKGFETTTRAELTRIAAGINAYYNDFHAYPGPVPENDVDLGTTSTVSGLTTITSSENALLGLLGGIKFVSATGPTYDQTLITTGVQSLNPLNPKTYNPYIDVTAEELSPKDSSGNYIAFNSTSAPKDSVVPEFLDHIPGNIIGSSNANFQYGPILYMRCRAGATGAGSAPTNVLSEASTHSSPKSPYFFKQVAPYGFTAANPTDFPAANGYTSQGVYFSNPSLQNQPKGKDTFVLISAGTDRIYGTKDDIIYSN